MRYNGFMVDKNNKLSRWVTVLLTAEAHRELTVMALDAEVSLAKLARTIFCSFLEEDKAWQSQVISKVKAIE